MTVYIDADACPVVRLVEKISEKYEIPVVILCDLSHMIDSVYGEVILVDPGPDAVDFALVGRCREGDIVVTQDYGVACMALGKKAFPIHQSGQWYSNENIDELMMARHIAKKVRRTHNRGGMKGPSKRTDADDRKFAESFEKLIITVSRN